MRQLPMVGGHSFDVLVIGAGGAGMMCALHAGRRGRSVALIDHAEKPGRKILISGGGRCNFTNIHAAPPQFVSQNPHFCKSALSRYTPDDFLGMVKAHGIPFHEKKLGQLFCDDTAQRIVNMLVTECERAGAKFFLGHAVAAVEKRDGRFHIRAGEKNFSSDALVIATGGLSIPKIGATGFGYEIARQFGLNVIEPAPALDGFEFGAGERDRLGGLAGVSVDAEVRCGGSSFRENILFTHVGLSGPAALQASLYWRAGDPVGIDFLPRFTGGALAEWFFDKKAAGSRAEIKNILPELLPKRFVEKFCEWHLPQPMPLNETSDKTIREFCRKLQDWKFTPEKTVGFGKAEVTRGGVDTDELSSKTMEAKKARGLYFIGEVVDVTGWLGGYNFQWAWASGWAAGQAA